MAHGSSVVDRTVAATKPRRHVAMRSPRPPSRLLPVLAGILSAARAFPRRPPPTWRPPPRAVAASRPVAGERAAAVAGDDAAPPRRPGDDAAAEAFGGPDGREHARHPGEIPRRDGGREERAEVASPGEEDAEKSADAPRRGLLNFRVLRPEEEEPSTDAIIDPVRVSCCGGAVCFGLSGSEYWHACGFGPETPLEQEFISGRTEHGRSACSFHRDEMKLAKRG